MLQSRAYLNLSSITGISRLDDRPQCFWGSYYEEPYDTYVVLRTKRLQHLLTYSNVIIQKKLVQTHYVRTVVLVSNVC